MEKTALNREVKPIPEEHTHAFGKGLAGAVLHPAVLHPSSITPSDLFPPRIKGNSYPLHHSSCLYGGTMNHHRGAVRAADHPGGRRPGSTWCHRRGRGRCFFGYPGQQCHLIPASSPRGGHAFCVIRTLIAQLRGQRNGCFILLFL